MNFQREIRQLKLWQFVDRSLSLEETVLQSDIIKFSNHLKLGSKKTILSILTDFIQKKLIEEIELPSNGVGRPRKAYTRPKGGKNEMLLVDLSNLPVLFRNYINDQSINQNLGKAEVMIQLLTWAFLLYQNGLLHENQVLKEPIPSHLQSKVINHESLRSL